MMQDLLIDKLELGIKVSGFGIGEVDYINDTIHLDERAAEIFELTANVPLSRDVLHQRIHPSDWPDIADKVDYLLHPEGTDFVDVEHRIIKQDGTVAWINARKQVRFAPDPETGQLRPVSGVAAILDVTRQKASEDHIRYLMDELNHRSKNLITVIQTIARMSASDDAEREFAERFSDRIRALAHNQDELVNDRETHLSVADLVAFHLRPFVDTQADRLISGGPDIRLKPDVAQAIGMAFHELATNAVKYGALGSEDGTVTITWDASGAQDADFTLTWTESGGPAVVAPDTFGFGQKVIRSMTTAVVNGTADVDYSPAGLVWQLKAALSDVQSRPVANA